MISWAAPPKEQAQVNTDLGLLQNLQLLNEVFLFQSWATTSPQWPEGIRSKFVSAETMLVTALYTNPKHWWNTYTKKEWDKQKIKQRSPNPQVVRSTFSWKSWHRGRRWTQLWWYRRIGNTQHNVESDKVESIVWLNYMILKLKHSVKNNPGSEILHLTANRIKACFLSL